MSPKRVLVAASLLALAVPLGLLAQATGSEFQANTYTTHDQRRPHVGVQPGGSFVVVWNSNPKPSPAPTSTGQDGDGAGIFGQLFDASGATVGSEFQINSDTTGTQFAPRVAVNGSTGDFVVVWTTLESGISGQRFTASGGPIGSEFQVSSSTAGIFSLSDVAVASAGDFVVVWSSTLEGGPGLAGEYGVFARRYDASGAPLAGEFQVNTYTTGYQDYPKASFNTAGDFMVVWWDGQSNYDGSASGVKGRLFSSGGAALTPEFQVNTTTVGYQYAPDVASDASGNFVVVWTGYNPTEYVYNIFGQRFDGSATPVGSEFLVSSVNTTNSIQPQVATDATGNMYVVWNSLNGLDGSQEGVFSRRLDSSGAPLADQFQVNAYTKGWQHLPTIGTNADGDVVVAWASGPVRAPFQTTMTKGQDGDRDGIFGQVCSSIADSTPPTVSIIGPKSTSKLRDGFSYDIRWAASDNCSLGSFDVSYSTNGGASYTPLCSSLPADARSCNWPAPLPITTKGRVRVEAFDLASNSTTVSTGANFEIKTGTPSITVTKPSAAGITWKAGTVQTIKWNHNTGMSDPVKVEVSRNGGVNWQPLEQTVANSGSTTGTFSWFVTPGGQNNPGTTNALIRVTSLGHGGIQDVSDNPFTIKSRVKVTQPNTAASYAIGSTLKIKWDHNYGANQTFGIEIDRDFVTTPNGPWELIVAEKLVSSGTTGSYDWTVTGPDTTNARIRVRKVGDRRNNDVSDVEFTISP